MIICGKSSIQPRPRSSGLKLTNGTQPWDYAAMADDNADRLTQQIPASASQRAGCVFEPERHARLDLQNSH
jgi:hypothetical protein